MWLYLVLFVPCYVLFSSQATLNPGRIYFDKKWSSMFIVSGQVQDTYKTVMCCIHGFIRYRNQSNFDHTLLSKYCQQTIIK